MDFVFLILAVVGFLLGLGFMFAKSSDGTPGWPVGIGMWVLALVFLGLASTTVVGARNIGIVNTFGKVSEHPLPSGLHWKSPVASVTDMDGALQNERYVGQQSTDEHPGCIGVKIADGQTACVSVVTQHQFQTDAADSLFVDYRQADEKMEGDINDAINQSLVRTQLTQALGQVFGGFDPLTDAGIGAGASVEADSQGIDYTGLSTELLDIVNEKLKDEDGQQAVTVKRASITYVYFAEATQRRINQYQEEVAKTRIAQQRKETAIAEAEANKELSDSISNDPNVLVSKCFDLAAEGKDIGFSCWPMGTNGPTLTTPVR